jgi:outer membrane protein
MMSRPSPSRLRRLVASGAAALVLLVLAARPVAAQQDDAARTVTFSDALTLALDQNTDLRRAATDVQRLDAQTDAEWFDFSPDLTLSTFGQRQFGRNFNQEQGQIVNQVNDVFSSSASASLRLFDGFANVASLQAAQRRGEAGELTLARTRQDVVFTVMQQFLTLVQNRELVRVNREQLEAQRRQLERIRELVAAGARPPSEEFNQEAQVAAAESTLLTAERDVQIAETRLIQTLQLDPFGTYDFEAPTLAEGPLQEASYDVRTLLQTALDRRFDLKAQRASVRAAEQQVRVARAGYFPTLDLSVNYGSNWASTAILPVPNSGESPEQVSIPTVDGDQVPYFVPGTGSPTQFQQPGFFDQLDNRRGGSVSFRIGIPVFNRLDTRAQLRQARVSARQAAYDLQDQRQQIGLEVRQAYLDYETAAKQLDVTQVQLRAARQARDAAEERYNLGAAPFVELAQANAEFVDAASQRVRARYDFVFQKKRIDYLRGTLDPRDSLFR